MDEGGWRVEVVEALVERGWARKLPMADRAISDVLS